MNIKIVSNLIKQYCEKVHTGRFQNEEVREEMGLSLENC